MIQFEADAIRSPQRDICATAVEKKPPEAHRSAAVLPNELWMSCMAHLDAPSAAAARAVSKNFNSLIDAVHPELLLPKAKRVYQSRPQRADPRLVEGILNRAKTLTFFESAGNKVIKIPKYWDTDRCSEPERIWQMVSWAPKLTELTISHADALSELSELETPPRLPRGLKHLCLEGDPGSMLHEKIYGEVFSGSLSNLDSLHVENIHFVDVPYRVPLRGASFFPQLTSLELRGCFFGPDLIAMLLATKITTLQNVVLKGMYAAEKEHDRTSPKTLLDFVGESRASLRRVALGLQPAFEKREMTAWLVAQDWPNLQSMDVAGLQLRTDELQLFDCRAFAALTCLRLPSTSPSQERFRQLGQMQGRQWEVVALGHDDWIDMTQVTHTTWLAEPAFAQLKTLRLRLSTMNARTAQKMIGKLRHHLMYLSLTGLDTDPQGIASLASFLRVTHLPHLRELEVTSDYLCVSAAHDVLTEMPYDVWIEDWDDDGLNGFYL